MTKKQKQTLWRIVASAALLVWAALGPTLWLPGNVPFLSVGRGPEDKVLIIDDFMAKGNAMQGLIDLVNEAGATLKGIGVAVEKGFQGGGDRFRSIPGVPYKALAVIESAEPGNIVFREED